MMRELGCPSHFVTFSSAEMHWRETQVDIERRKYLSCFPNKDASHINTESDSVKNLSASARRINTYVHPYEVVCSFLHRIRGIIKLINAGALGNSNGHAIELEYQMRLALHAHGMVWIKEFVALLELIQ